MKDVPLKAKIYLQNYENSGSLEWADIEANLFKMMVMVNDKLECWTLRFEVLEDGSYGNKLLKVEDQTDQWGNKVRDAVGSDDIITLDTSEWSEDLKKSLKRKYDEVDA